MAQNIDRKHPALILLMIDQSGSMAEKIDDTRSKAEVLKDDVNKLILNMVLRATSLDEIRDYFYVGVLGYASGVDTKFIQTPGPQVSDVIPISVVANNQLRMEKKHKDDGAGGLVTIELPVWVEAKANGSTSMRAAFDKARTICEDWIRSHGDCVPPTIINLTDGESTDGSPLDIANEIKSMASSEGNARIFNVHIALGKNPFKFPNGNVELPDEFAQMLFEMSSPLTKQMVDYGRSLDIKLEEDAVGFVFNADSTLIIMALDIGTRNFMESELR